MNTVDFIKRCIVYYGYKPIEIQTDNGTEFTWNQSKIKKVHPMDQFCLKEDIFHHTIRPRTPRHNEKEVIEMIMKDSIVSYHFIH